MNIYQALNQQLLRNYEAARDALTAEAVRQFQALSEDAELIAALAFKFESTQTATKRALANVSLIRVGPRHNWVGDHVGIEFLVTRKSGRHNSWKSVSIPLEAFRDEAVFKKWRDGEVAETTKRSLEAEQSVIRQARSALRSYRTLPAEVRKANPLFGAAAKKK